MNDIDICAYLIKNGTLTESEFRDAKERQKTSGMRLRDLLLNGETVSEMEWAYALSRSCKLDLFVGADLLQSEDVVQLITKDTAIAFSALQLFTDGEGVLTAAMSDPFDRAAVEELEALTGMKVRSAVASHKDIKDAIERSFGMRGAIEEAVFEVYGENNSSEESTELGADIRDGPVVRLVNDIIERAVRMRASDIHIEPSVGETIVRFRIDGMLSENMRLPKSLHGSVAARIKITAGCDIAEKRRPQDGRLFLNVGGEKIDIRVSTVPSIYGEKCVLRLLPQKRGRLSLDELGFNDSQESMLSKAVKAPYGIFLVTGPTGSGKSTTLYSLLNVINRPEANIMTIEDPVEYTIGGITQIQVNEKAGLTFENALRSIFRQDPDKLMVGEIRDGETARLAVRLALTGHLVLSTLHTNNAPGAVNRLLDMGIPNYLLAASLNGIASQRLVRKLCPHCKEECEFDAAEAERLEVRCGMRHFKAAGCPSCRFTGYSGRTVIAEVMSVDTEVRNMINANVPTSEIRNYARSRGMMTLKESALEKVLNGVTTLDEMYASAVI